MHSPRATAPTIFLILASTICSALMPASSSAQTKSTPSPASQKEVAEETQELKRLRAQLVQATDDYKKSLGQLLALYEADIKRADERLARTKELYVQGLVGKRDIEKDEAAAAGAREKVTALQAQIKSADEEVSEALAQAESEETAKKLVSQKRRRERTGDGRVYYVRFVIVGEVAIYDYSGAIRGHVIKHRQKILIDSRR